MFQEPAKKPKLVGFVKDHKRPLKLRLGGVLKVVDVLSNHLSIDYQVALNEANNYCKATISIKSDPNRVIDKMLSTEVAVASSYLLVNHVGDHKDLVIFSIGELQWQLGRLNIPRADPRLGTLQQICASLKTRHAILRDYDQEGTEGW